MGYTVTPETTESGSIRIRITYNRKKYYVKSGVRINEGKIENGRIVGNPNDLRLNRLLRKKIQEAEQKFLDALLVDDSPEGIKAFMAGGKSIKIPSFFQFYNDIIPKLSQRLSEGRIRHLWSVANKVNAYAPGLKFTQINTSWMLSFEKHIWEAGGLSQNTVNSNMKALIGLLNKAADHNYISPDAWKGYKKLDYVLVMLSELQEKVLGKRKAIDIVSNAQKLLQADYREILSKLSV